MMTLRKFFFLPALAAISAAIGSAPARSQEIVIGQVGGFTGPVAKNAQDVSLGAKVLIEATNERGGIGGRKLRLLAVDDNYKPEETSRLVSSMIGKASALLPLNGSANIARVLKDGVLEGVTLPIVGTIPAPESLRVPLHKNIFHFRAGDRDQIEKIIEHLNTVGNNGVGVVAPKNPFGEQGIALFQQALQKRSMKLNAVGLLELRGTIDFKPVLKTIRDANPQAVVLLGPPQTVADLVREFKRHGESAVLYTLSYADVGLIVKTAGGASASGVAISQVLPNVNNKAIPLIKAFRQDFATYGKTAEEPSYLHLEGYISVRLILEAIRKTNDPSPEGVKRGLEQLRNFDIDGFNIDLSPTKHTGSVFVDISLIGKAGRLVY